MNNTQHNKIKISDIRQKSFSDTEVEDISLPVTQVIVDDSEDLNVSQKDNTESNSKNINLEEMLSVSSSRRKLLKYAFLGGGVFMLGKIFGPGINIFGEDTKITDFKNFRVVESKLGLQFFDKFGNEILSLDKDS